MTSFKYADSLEGDQEELFEYSNSENVEMENDAVKRLKFAHEEEARSVEEIERLRDMFPALYERAKKHIQMLEQAQIPVGIRHQTDPLPDVVIPGARSKHPHGQIRYEM